jgi:hypothetical protein
MLGRLDDVMEENEEKINSASNLPIEMAGETVQGITLEQSNQLLAQEKLKSNNTSDINDNNNLNVLDPSAPLIQLTHNIYPGARPILTNKTPRLPLNVVVKDLVNQWSIGFLDLAKSGDSSAMCLVAQMYYSSKGWGLIKQNKQAAIDWTLKAVDCNDVEARELARRLCPEELKAHLKRRGLNDAKLQKEEAAANHHFK